MPALITVTQLREHVETDLVDAALQRVIDDADAAIVERYGAHTGNVVETRAGGGRLIFLERPVTAVVSIAEYNGMPFDETLTNLVADDYRLWYGGRAIERLASGTNARTAWGDRVVITTTPAAETARRTRVEIDLCRVALTYAGVVKNESAGDYESGGSVAPASYQAEREALLDELAPALAMS